MFSAGGTALLGIVFWGLAAHLATPTALGRTSAEIAAMVFLANLAQLSFGTIFERFLPVAGPQTGLFIRRAYYLCTVFATVASIVYLVAGLGDRFIPTGVLWHVYFVIAVVMWTLFILQDSALIGLRASRWVPVENILFAAAKLALLPLAISLDARQGIYVAWTTPVILTIAGVTWYLFGRRVPDHQSNATAVEELPRTRELVALAGAQYATLLYTVFTPSIVTLIVIARLGPIANAHYYIPTLITSGLGLFIYSIVRSFIVEAVSEPWALRRHTNTAIKAMVAIVTPTVTVGAVFAPLVLRVFGGQYSNAGTTLLRMLLISVPLYSISNFYSAFAWLDRKVWWMTIRDLISVIIYFAVLLTLIGRLHLIAVGVAGLVASGLQALFFLPASVRRYRRTSNGPAPSDMSPA